MWTIPNLLTLGRLLLVPFVAWRLAVHDVFGAFLLFALAAVTDMLDGYLARRLNQRSVLGAWLDPIADKVMLLTTLTMLTLIELLPIWLLAVVVVRDLVVIGGAEAYRRLTGRLDMQPILSGKAATAMEFVLVSLVLADIGLEWGADWIILPLAALTAIVVALSGLRYVWLWTGKTRAFLRQAAELEKLP